MAPSERGGTKKQRRGQAQSGQVQTGGAAPTQPERQAGGTDARTLVLQTLQQRLERQDPVVDAPGEAAPTQQRQAGGADARTLALATLQERQERDERMVGAPQPQVPAWGGHGVQPRQQADDPDADLDTWDQPTWHDPQARDARAVALENLDQGSARVFGAKAVFDHEMKKRL